MIAPLYGIIISQAIIQQPKNVPGYNFRCDCDKNIEICDPLSGQCYCRSEGYEVRCNRCENKYKAHFSNGTSCYHELEGDHTHTLKLDSQRKNDYSNEILLYSVSYKKDVDVTFQVNCDSPNGNALLEVIRTSYYADGRERSTGTLMFDRVCDPKGIKSAFVVSEDAHPNPDYNTTFFVRIYNFTTPAQVVISFAQILPNTFRLTIFLFSVSSVMILLIACVFIYVKLSMRNNEEQRRMVEELERMAARPFASTKMELTVLSPPSSTVDPVPLTIEPCQDYRSGVFTLAVRLPTGGKAVTPSGTSGLAVASSLCFLSPEQVGELQVKETEEQKNTENLPKKTKIQRRPSSI